MIFLRWPAVDKLTAYFVLLSALTVPHAVVIGWLDRQANRRLNVVPPIRMIPPGSSLGLLGGGQLARMTALAARRMGYRISTLDPAGDAAPAAPVCDRVVRGAYDDPGALEEFARGLDAASFEFENIPPAAVQLVGKHCPVHPRWQALEICQHREREKNFLHQHGYPHAAFRVVTTPAELADAMAALGVALRAQDRPERLRRQGPAKDHPRHRPRRRLGTAGAAANPGAGWSKRGWNSTRSFRSSARATGAANSCRSPCSRTSTPGTSST